MAKTTPNTSSATDALARIFAGDEAGVVCEDGVADLFVQISDSPSVQRVYNQLAEADRALSGEEIDSPFERSFGEASFLDALDAQLDEEANPEPDNVIQFSWTRVAMAAAVLLAASVVYVAQLESPDEFQARSAIDVSDVQYARPKLQAFCVERTEDGPKFTASAEQEFALLKCDLQNELKLAYGNTDARLKYVSFFGIDSQRGTIHWYGPSPSEPNLRKVVVSEDWTPVGETVRLNVNHEPGAVHIMGVFTEQPVEFEELSSWVKTQSSSMSRAGEFKLRWKGVMTRVEMEITEGQQ